MKNKKQVLILLVIMFLGILVYGFFREENLKEENSEILKIEKNKKIFYEVNTLERLEFFKIDSMIKKKMLMLYIYSNNCFYCTQMKENTLSSTMVKEVLSKEYQVVHINYSENRQVFKPIFKLNGTPAIIFFDRDGRLLENESFYGYKKTEDFYNKIKFLAK